MPTFLNPNSLAMPRSSFSHGVMHGPPLKRLLISGQVGANRNGEVGHGLAEQTETVFDNIEAVLRSADMGLLDLVKLTIFCVPLDGGAIVRDIRDRRLATHRPASSFLYVSALANPACLIEIEGEAICEFR